MLSSMETKELGRAFASILSHNGSRPLYSGQCEILHHSQTVPGTQTPISRRTDSEPQVNKGKLRFLASVI